MSPCIQFIPVDQPGHVIAVWRDPGNVSEVEVYRDAADIAGFVEVLILATLLLAQCHYPIGDYNPNLRD